MITSNQINSLIDLLNKDFFVTQILMNKNR